MACHTLSGRGNPGPTPSPSPGPGPGPGALERVALKKEIGLLSACTIIIGERTPDGRVPEAAGPKAWGARLLGKRGTPLLEFYPVCDCGTIGEEGFLFPPPRGTPNFCI